MVLNGFTRYLFLSALISLMTIVYLGKNFSNQTTGSMDPTLDFTLPLSDLKLNYQRFFSKITKYSNLFDQVSPEHSNGIQDEANFSIPSNLGPMVPSVGFSYILQFLDLNQLQLMLSKYASENLFLNQQKISALVFINTGFLFLYVLGSLIIKIFFDELREIENQHMYDRVLNFLLFKVVFLGAILEPKWDEMILWVSWFAVIGFLRVFSMLCRDRCEYLSEASGVSTHTRIKVLSFLGLIILADLFWFTVCLSSFSRMIFLLAFECFTLFLDTIQTLVKYLIHIKDSSSTEIWEERDVYLRKTEFYTDASILVITLIHYIQIAFLHGISFTLIDAVLFLNIRSVFKSLCRKYTLFKGYLSAIEYMEARFPNASKTELEDSGGNCPICLDAMIVAQKLPCLHIFHGRCLRLWLENHQSCPSCRKELDKSADDEEALLNSSNNIRSSNAEQSEPRSVPSLHNHQGSPPPSGLGWDRGLGVINNF